MSRQSTKSAGRSSKTSRGTAKKTAKPAAKSARGTVKKASKSARQPVGKTQASKTPLGKVQVAKVQSKAPAIKAQSVKSSAVKAQTAVKTASRPASRLPEPLASAAAPIIHTASPPVQPILVPDVPLRAHKYRVGETVYYTSPTFGRAAATGSYTVVKLLPSDGDDYQYRIKSSGEAFERVAKESQLDKP